MESLQRSAIPRSLAMSSKKPPTFGDTPFAGDVFEETDHEHFEIDDRVNAWTASSVHRIGGSTQRTGLGRKVEGGESLVEFGIERGSSGPHKLRKSDKEFRGRL